jgi:hypothetical protein
LVVAALPRDRRGELMQRRIARCIRKQAPAHGVRGGQIAMAQSSDGGGQSIYGRSTRLIWRTTPLSVDMSDWVTLPLSIMMPSPGAEASWACRLSSRRRRRRARPWQAT